MDSLWAKLQKAQDDGDPPEQLAELVRAIKEGETGGESFSSEQRKLLVEAATAALEPAVVNLLRAERVSEFAPSLVAARACDLNEVAQALAGKELLELPDRARKSLQAKLESRSKILERTPVSRASTWFDTFCSQFPTERDIQHSPWSHLETLLGGDGQEASRATPAQERAAWEVWSEGRELRQMVLRYTLPPVVADLIEAAGFPTVTTMTKDDMNSIMKDTLGADRSKLMRMWRCESAAGKEAEASRKTRASELKKKTKQAFDLAATMKSHIDAGRTNALSEAQQQFEEVGLELGLGEWKQGLKDPSDPNKMLERLTSISNILVASERESVAGEAYDSDEKVVGYASGGLAMYGVSLGLEQSEIAKKPAKPLIRAPQYCPLISPEVGYTTKEEIFFSTESANRFRSAVTSCGASISAAVQASGWGFHAEASHSSSKSSTEKNKEQAEFQSNTAIHMVYAVVPTKAFRIPEEDMVLTVEARNAALAVSSRAEARCFLEDYGSHIPSGNQHLGGVFWKIVEMKADEKTSATTLETAMAAETNNSLAVGMSGWGSLAPLSGGASASKGSFDKTGTATGDTKSASTYSLTTKIECTGPPITSYDMFVKVLVEKNQSWHIIDRGGIDGLVPVWNVLESSGDGDLMATGNMLREEWIELARRATSCAQIVHLVYRARLAIPAYASEGSSVLEGQHVNPDSSPIEEANVLASVDQLCSLDVQSIDTKLLRYQVQQVFAKIARFDCQSKRFILATLLRGAKLPGFLKTIAGLSSQDNV
ncbi:hypothetical protein PHYPSEUDO_014547 [Phytophthora pseudosyringae]|uniref:MACPF domain-containing protein n=1 Tax=Phytophthora pseudosyringae TaxID=221518 RepID=A0A8T1W1Q6_9STRA|nr:hypothetical protein PHYPSEUDO_014547 [Phytophthora pseudosyringae]